MEISRETHKEGVGGNSLLFSQSDHQKQALQLVSDLHNHHILITARLSSDTRWLPWAKEATLLTTMPLSPCYLYPMTGWCRGYESLAPSPQHSTTLKSHASSRVPSGTTEVSIVTSLYCNSSLCPDLLLFLCLMCCSWEPFPINFHRPSLPWELACNKLLKTNICI